MIIVALQKVSSLHSSSKLLLRCLAYTDLCVGLILQPLYIRYLLSTENSKYCYYFEPITYILAAVFCGVSLSTLTPISVDRLLALLLGLRYRHALTLRRVQVLVVLVWLYNGATAMRYLYNDILTVAIICTGLLLCLITSTFCYTKIFIVVHHHHIHVQVHDDDDQEECNKVGTHINIARYKKTVSSAIWVQIALVVCYLPFGIATMVVYLSDTYPPFLALAWELTLFLLTLNSSLNPISLLLENQRSKTSSEGNSKEAILSCQGSCTIGLGCNENNYTESMLITYRVRCLWTHFFRVLGKINKDA